MVIPENVIVNNSEAKFIFPCVGYSNQSTLAISWLHSGQRISTNQNDMKIHTTSVRKEDHYVAMSFLELCVSGPENIANYSCVASIQQQKEKEQVFFDYSN